MTISHQTILSRLAKKNLRLVKLTAPLRVSEWADRHRWLSGAYTPKRFVGPYRLAMVPYAEEPMDAALDNEVRAVCLLWAAQTTKTTLLENVCGYFIAEEPSPILMVQPTVEMAQAWSKERFAATVRETPVLRRLVHEARSRDESNTIQLKTFPGGSLAIIGANAPSGLAGRPRRVVLLDEVDRYPSSAGTEGDPAALAIKRTETFYNAVIYLTSTPTMKGFSRIELEFEQTDKRKWHVPCPACGKMQTLEWEQVKYEKENIAGAWYECVACGHRLDDAERLQAIRRGKWIPTAPFAGRRGYFLNGICSPFPPKKGFASRLHQMVVEFLEAERGGPEQQKTWRNTFLAQTYEEEAETIEISPLLSRVELYSPDRLPLGVILVVGGADVQKNRVEVEWIGVGLEEETWGIEVVRVWGDTDQPDTWRRLTEAMQRVFKREDGVELRPRGLAIDTHYSPRSVRQWVGNPGTRFPVFPVLGIGAHQGKLWMERWAKTFRQRTWTISTDAAKDLVFYRLRVTEAGPRYCHFPRGFGYTDEWFQQLTCERAVTRYVHGYAKRMYEKPSGARNEALDMRVYALVCLDILGPNLPQESRNLTVKPDGAVKVEERPIARPWIRQPAYRGGWVKGWR